MRVKYHRIHNRILKIIRNSFKAQTCKNDFTEETLAIMIKKRKLKHILTKFTNLIIIVRPSHKRATNADTDTTSHE